MDFRKLLQEERRRARESAAPKPLPSDPVATSPTPKHLSAADDISSSAAHCETTDEPLSCWHPRTLLDLEPFRVPGIKSVFCIPEWLSQDEEDAILSRVYNAPASAWVQLKLRRLQMYGGEVQVPFHAEPLPRWLEQLAAALVESGVFRAAHAPNHVLINEYGVGEGILPHEDGPSYFPLVAIASTGADAFVTFSPHRQYATDSSLQEIRFAVRRRSLLLFTKDAYTKYLHSIDGIERGKRVSLTIRRVIETRTETESP